MWGFFILLTVYIEAYGFLFQPNFHIPIIGRWEVLGFLQDFFATAVFLGITTFAIIRLLRSPREIGRSSRFYGSHTGGAWLVLFMIFNVILTYVFVRGSAVNNGTLPYGNGAFLSQQDFFAVAVLIGIITFAIIRLRSEPKEYGRGRGSTAHTPVAPG